MAAPIGTDSCGEIQSQIRRLPATIFVSVTNSLVDRESYISIQSVSASFGAHQCPADVNQAALDLGSQLVAIPGRAAITLSRSN